MKITKIETIRIPEHPNLIWIKIHTDEGITGLGESWFGAEAIEADIHSRIAPIIIGKDPKKIENIFNKPKHSYTKELLDLMPKIEAII